MNGNQGAFAFVPGHMRRLIALTFALSAVTVACGDSTTSAGSDPETPETTSSTVESVTTELPRDDQPLGGGSYPIGELTVSWGDPLSEEQSYTISCLGDTATLSGEWDQSGDTLGDIAADKMCTRLADPDVQTRLVDGPPADQVCTQIFGSDHSAVVSGSLDGTEVAAEFHRADGCGIDDWDVLMADVLPSV